MNKAKTEAPSTATVYLTHEDANGRVTMAELRAMLPAVVARVVNGQDELRDEAGPRVAFDRSSRVGMGCTVEFIEGAKTLALDAEVLAEEIRRAFEEALGVKADVDVARTH